MARPRKPCARCGGEKPPGERRRYCDACVAPAAQERAEKARQRSSAWYRENHERALATKAWRTAHPDRVIQAVTTWNRENIDKVRAYKRACAPTRCVAAPPVTIALVPRPVGAVFIEPLVVLELDDGVCGICGEDVDPCRFHVDHIIPLSRGGSHTYMNVQPAHPVCNIRKGAKMPKEMV